MRRNGRVLNLSLLGCIFKNPGIAYDDLWEMNKDMMKCIFDNDLQALVAEFEVKEIDGHYWVRQE